MRRCELRSMITRIFEGPPLGFNKGRLLKHLEWTDRDKSSRPDPTTEATAVRRVGNTAIRLPVAVAPRSWRPILARALRHDGDLLRRVASV